MFRGQGFCYAYLKEQGQDFIYYFFFFKDRTLFFFFWLSVLFLFFIFGKTNTIMYGQDFKLIYFPLI